jgi:hypothetical protein
MSLVSIASATEAQEWRELCQWAGEHYRSRTFPKDVRIPTRPDWCISPRRVWCA